MAEKLPRIDKGTLKIMENLVRLPPKPHEEMKLGGQRKKPKRAKKKAAG
jgi:hypothetical protein